MSSGDPANEQVAQLLASRGRDALVERLRHAYAQAAEAHSDVLSIDGDRLETIVQGAADRADGLQWRRALADVASGELGISLTDALAHPAVTRAQEIVGAPSYEDSLAALGRRSVPPVSQQASAEGKGPQPEPEPETTTQPDPEPQATTDPEPQATTDPEPQATTDPEPQATTDPEPQATTDPEPQATTDPEPQATTEPEPQATTEPEPQATAQPEPPPAEDAPPWHAMTQHQEPEQEPETEPAPEPPAPHDAPDESEAATMVQPRLEDPAPHAEPALAQEPEPETEPAEEPVDPDATQEWSARHVAQPGQAASPPPQPTHVVPAPLPPETNAGGHLPAPERQPPASEPLDGPAWVPDEPEYGDDPDFQHSPAPKPGQPDQRLGAEPDRLRVSAIHLGGVANVPTNREGLDIRLSSHGFDIMRDDDQILGRLGWSEIDALEVPSPRVRRRRNRDRARLIVRTAQGDATFEVPGFSGDELHERIVPLVDRFGHH